MRHRTCAPQFQISMPGSPPPPQHLADPPPLADHKGRHLGQFNHHNLSRLGDVVRHVGDRHYQAESPALAFAKHRIVEIPRGFAIDGDQRKLGEILPALQSSLRTFSGSFRAWALASAEARGGARACAHLDLLSDMRWINTQVASIGYDALPQSEDSGGRSGRTIDQAPGKEPGEDHARTVGAC